jgi:Uma2 family endonuclease
MTAMRQAQRHYSVDEYLSLTKAPISASSISTARSSLSGGSRKHNLIARNLTRSFHALRGNGCRAYMNDWRLHTPAGLFTYPDVMLVCGAAALTHDSPETITNPVLIAEVLSASTGDYDRGQKFDLYRTIPARRDYVLADQYAIDVEHRFPGRGAGGIAALHQRRRRVRAHRRGGHAPRRRAL